MAITRATAMRTTIEDIAIVKSKMI